MLHLQIRSCYNPVTGVALLDKTLIQVEIEKLANSSVLHGSESLCKLLRYIAKHALDHPGVSLMAQKNGAPFFSSAPKIAGAVWKARLFYARDVA